MSDNAQAGGGTTGNSGSGAGNATIDPEVEKRINETINRTIGNRLGRGTIEKLIADGVAKALSGEALSGAVEAAIVKMSQSDEPADTTQAAGNGATAADKGTPAPANDELQQMKAQFAALQKQLADERKQAETRVREAADQARLARVSAHVKATLGDKIKGNPALVELLTKELVRDQKAVDEIDGNFVWRGKQPDGAGGFIEEHRPFEDGFGEWVKTAGKNFIPAAVTRLPASGGLPYDGSQARGAGDPGNGAKPTPRMASVFSQMQRDLGSAVSPPMPGGDGNPPQQ